MIREDFLVSGGSGGIGAALCRRLAELGYRPIVGFSGNARAADEIARETGGMALSLELTSDDAIDKAVEIIADNQNPLAGVVLAASPPPTIGPLGKATRDELSLQWNVNVSGPCRLVSGLVRSCLRRRKSGVVIAVLSDAMGTDKETAARYMGPYIIAKYGLLGLIRAMQAEYPWLETGVVRPGFTETGMLESFDPRFLETIRATLADRKFASPEDVAAEISDMIAGNKRS